MYTTASERIREARSSAEVRELVREFRAGGGFYDDDAVRFVAERLGCEPTRELSSACYYAKGDLRDEEARAKRVALLDEGFVPFADAAMQAGKRYEVLRSTTYCGREVPDYSGPVTCRVVDHGGRIVLLPGRNRTHGYYPNASDLVRAV